MFERITCTEYIKVLIATNRIVVGNDQLTMDQNLRGGHSSSHMVPRPLVMMLQVGASSYHRPAYLENIISRRIPASFGLVQSSENKARF